MIQVKIVILVTIILGVFIGNFIGWDEGVKSDAESCTKTGFFYYHDQVFRCEKK